MASCHFWAHACQHCVSVYCTKITIIMPECVVYLIIHSCSLHCERFFVKYTERWIDAIIYFVSSGVGKQMTRAVSTCVPKGAISSTSSPRRLIGRRHKDKSNDSTIHLYSDHSTPPSRCRTASLGLSQRDLWRCRCRRFGQQLTSGRQSGPRPTTFGPVVFLRTCRSDWRAARAGRVVI